MKIGFLAFALFHTLVPALCVAFYGASPVWVVGSLLFSTAVLLTIQPGNKPIFKVLLCTLSGLSMFLTLMLGVSYYMQGTGFNDQYFYHLDMNTLAIATQAYGGIFYSSVVFLIIAFFSPLILYRQDYSIRPGNLAVALIWVAAVATVYPLYSLVNYWAGLNDEMSDRRRNSAV